MNVLSHFQNFQFPSEVLLYAIDYLSKVAFSNIRIFPGNVMVSFLKVANKITN